MGALWGFTGPEDPALAGRMQRALQHRGGHLLDQPLVAARWSIGVGLARPDARLGGIAVSQRTGTAVAIVGRLPRSTSVVELLDAVDRDGVTSLEGLAGEWIVAVATADRLTIMRDPAGARAAYWARLGDRVLVAVEPKGIHTIPGFRRDIDPAALAQYLTFSFVPGARTMLTGLHELAAGHRLDIGLSDGTTDVTRYFDDGPAHAVDQLDVRPWIEATRDAVTAAIVDRLPGDEPVTAFLSGGLDSSIVTAVAAAHRRAAGHPPPTTLSLHFGPSHPNELEYARQVATRAGTEHHEVEVRPDDLPDRLARMVWHLDEPIGDPVTIGNFELARAAAGHADWVLNGEGGDPVFGGPKNLPMLLDHWYDTATDTATRRADTYLTTWRRAGEDVDRLLHPDLRRQVDPARDLAGAVRPLLAPVAHQSFLNTLMRTNMRLKGANLILPKVDRMLGAHRLTPLSPLFDPALIRLSLTMPPNLKLRAGVEKYVLKQAFSDCLPTAVLTRPKSGMRVPVHSWFQRELKRTADDVLSPRAVRQAGIFEPRRVRDLRRYRTGRDGLRLWMLVTFELWRRQVVERTATPG